MKLSPLLLLGSLAANAALVAVYVTRVHPETELASTKPLTTSPSEANAAARNTDGSKSEDRQNSSTVRADPAGKLNASGTWQALNTSDLSALAKRLRAAGFPPSAVRAIISTQIRENFRARREELLPSNEDRPFWKTDTNRLIGYDPKFYAAMRELGREQSKLMKEVLGDEATAGEPSLSDYQRRRYGNLAADKIEQLERLDQDYNDLRNEVNSAARGIVLPEDRQKLAMLEQERRADLAQILSPQEMEDYLMRTSQTTNRLRPALTSFNATEEEFRAIYQAQSAFDEKYNLPMMGRTGDADEMAKARQATDEKIKATLGEKRYAEYERASDRDFQQLSRMAQQSNLPDTVAVQVYELRNNALKESNRIFEDTALTPEQKRTAIQALGQTVRSDITTALGAEVGPRYLQTANRWLNSLDRGAAVTLTANGMNTRSVPVRSANPRPAAIAPSSAPAEPAAK